MTVNITDVRDQAIVEPPVRGTGQLVSEPDGEDFAANTSTIGRVAFGSSVTGNIGTSDDRDWFAVDLVAGRVYIIDLRGSSTVGGTLDDPYLYGVHDADGVLLPGTTNDDGGVDYNSRVEFMATETATYYVAAGAFPGAFQSGRGAYTLSVSIASDDFSAGIGTGGAVAVGGSVTGVIDRPRDRDWFEVTLEAGKT